MKNAINTILKENKGLIIFLILMAVFRSSLADWNHVPTGSMKPTIVEGDLIFIDKLAYDVRVPFAGHAMARLSDPERGDIIVFNSKVSDKRLVKRVIGIPGDIVEMRSNALLVNGQAVSYSVVSETLTSIDAEESFDGESHMVRFQKTASRASTFDPIMVPKEMYLALGDNRDNSADSRFIGFIPREEIIGRSKKVVASFNYKRYYLPRSGRFLKSL